MADMADRQKGAIMARNAHDDTTTDDTTDPATADAVDAVTTDDTTDPATADAVEPTTDPADDFRAAYAAALDAADPVTGTVPDVYRDAVAVAFRAMRGNARVAVPADCLSKATAAAMADPANVDVPRMLAANALAALIADTATTRASTTDNVDPVLAAADAVAMLNIAATLLAAPDIDPATWNAAVDERVSAMADALNRLDRGDAVTDDETVRLNKLHRVMSAATSRRKASASTATGVIRPAGSIAAHVAAVVATDPAKIWTVAEIAAAGSDLYAPGTASNGAISNAIRDGKATGVVATTTDKGNLAATGA